VGELIGEVRPCGRARGELGAAAVEYGLVIALVAVVLLTSVSALGDGLGDTMDRVGAMLEGPAQQEPSEPAAPPPVEAPVPPPAGGPPTPPGLGGNPPPGHDGPNPGNP
jgi:Flp pilus assembly pilin Flp